MTHSVFDSVVDSIARKNPFQKKRLRQFKDSCSPEFLDHAEVALASYLEFLSERNYDLERATDAYLAMVKSMLVEQVRFSKCGEYRYSSSSEVMDEIYDNDSYMTDYMVGLALSQFLWANHRDISEFLRKQLAAASGTTYMEVGPGHGFSFVEAIRLDRFENYEAIDLSQSSIDSTRAMMNFFVSGLTERVTFTLCDINDYQNSSAFDFVVMGEVLEHVENPKQVLESIRRLLRPEGKAFLSTCANCPVKDHIYLYKSVAEIRSQIESAGFKVEEELKVSVDGIPEALWEDKNANITYACIVTKAET